MDIKQFFDEEDVCRGLGFVVNEYEKTFTTTSGSKQYHQPEAVRWSRVDTSVDKP